MIRPLSAPRFTPRARKALGGFVEAWEGGKPALVVELDSPSAAGNGATGTALPDVRLRLVPAAEPQPVDHLEHHDDPVTLWFRSPVGEALEGLVIDFLDEEGGVRGFLVRTAGPSGSRASGPPSSPEASGPATPGPVSTRRAGPAPLVQLRLGRGVRQWAAAPVAEPSPPPHRASRMPDPDTSLEDRVGAQIRERVNPLVACHGGEVRLVRVRDDAVAEVAMLGGCQGCAAAAGTLRDVVSRILLRAVPELTGVSDVTVHEEGANPFLARA